LKRQPVWKGGVRLPLETAFLLRVARHAPRETNEAPGQDLVFDVPVGEVISSV